MRACLFLFGAFLFPRFSYFFHYPSTWIYYRITLFSMYFPTHNVWTLLFIYYLLSFPWQVCFLLGCIASMAIFVFITVKTSFYSSCCNFPFLNCTCVVGGRMTTFII